MSDRLREAIQWTANELRPYEGHPDLIPEPGRLVLAAAGRWLALTETGQICVSPNTNADVGGVCGLSVEKHPDTSKWPDDRHEIVPGRVLTETGPDYEAAFQVMSGDVSDHLTEDEITEGRKLVREAVDAALADYLTEEGP